MMIISIELEKALCKIQHLLMIKMLKKLIIEGIQLDKGHL